MADVHIKPDDIQWKTKQEGLRTKTIFKDDKTGLEWQIVKCSPNFVSPHHSHPNDEWVYVLKGSMKDDTGEYNAGDFLVNRKDSVHTAHIGPNGCTLLLISYGFPY